MAFSHLYNQLLPHWGPTLSFADGVILEHKNPFLALGKLKGQENTSAQKDHFHSEEFSKSWQRAEQHIAQTQLLEKQVLWAMYQVFHARARELFGQQVFRFSPSEVKMDEIESRLLKNLSEPGYEEELTLYRQLVAS